MANYFWIGGTADWDGTAGSKWSNTSGGGSIGTVPTINDDVWFDSNSTGTVTIASGATAKSITCTGFTGSLIGSTAITVGGSVTLDSTTMAGYSYAGRFTFTGSGTLTSSGYTLASFTINGAGITYGLGDDLTISDGGNTINITQGTFNTNNKTITTDTFFSISGTSTRTVNLGASSININAGIGTFWNAGTTTNLTFNAGTSTITCGGNATFSGGGLTYNNVVFSDGATRSLTGANTFANLTVQRTSNGIGDLSISANQTITGTLNCSGGSPVQRVFLRSSVLGTARTLTVATLTATDCDFRDIALLGAASGSSPTRAGNCKGNSNITFPAVKTVYWNLAGGGNWSDTGWAATGGGSPADTNFPLAQDTAVVQSTGLNNAGTITINNSWNIGSIDLSARTSNTATLASGGNTPAYYGDYTLGSGVTITGTGSSSFIGRTTQNITSAGRTVTFPIVVDGASTSFKLIDALTTTNSITHTQATIDCNSNALTCTSFNSNNSATRTIAFGTGSISVTGTGTVWTTATTTNLTVSGTPVVNVTNSTGTATTVSPGSLTEANSISFNFTAGTYSLTLTGNVRSLNFTGSSLTVNNSARSIYGDFTASSTTTFTAGSSIQTFASTNATARNITSNGVTFPFPITFNGVGGTWKLLDSVAMGSAGGRRITQTNGTLDLNGRTLTCTELTADSYRTAAGTKNLTFNGGILNVLGFTNGVPTGFTTTAGTGTGEIRCAGTFTGGGSTYNCTLAATASIQFSGSTNNTFTSITNLVSPTSFTFVASTTTTVTNWNVSGTPGNLVTIGSATAASHTLEKPKGTGNAVSNYLSISRSNATSTTGSGTAAIWYAGANSTNGGNNTGWLFTSPISRSFGTIIT